MSKLTSKAVFLLSALFLATGDNAPESDFCVPSNEGDWESAYKELQENRILDENNNLTGYGKARAHGCQSQGVNLQRLAEKNPNMAIAMLRESVNGIEYHYQNGVEFSDKAFKLFGETSARLGHLAATTVS